MKTTFRLLVSRMGFGAAILFLAGCTVGPNYKRPPVDTPGTYRRAASDTNSATGASSFADLGWWQEFQDPYLSGYLAEALTNSWDIKIAAARILQGEASLRITRSQFFPTLNAGGDIYNSRTSQNGPIPLPAGVDAQRTYGDLFVASPAYEVDLWGRIRRANQAARANLLASVEAQNTVRQTLVSDVATAYLTLLELDLELQISRRTYKVRTESLELTRSRDAGGVGSAQDVHQARILVYTAETAITDALRQIEEQENLLSILLGRNPGHVARGASLTLQNQHAAVPPGLPSSLLERRPDLRAAEQRLVAANANIGTSQGRFLPSSDPHGPLWLPNGGPLRSVHLPCARLAVRSRSDVSSLHRRKTARKLKACRGPVPGSGRFLPAIGSSQLPGGFKRPNSVPAYARICSPTGAKHPGAS